MNRARLTALRSRVMDARRAGDAGASAVEYALLAAAVAAIIALTVFAFGTLVLDLTSDNCTTIRDTASPSASCG